MGGEDRYPATSSDEDRPKDTEIESVHGFNLSSSEDEEPAERTSSVERRLIEANHFFYRYSTSYRPGAKEDKTSPSRVGWGNREVTTANKNGRVILFYIQT